MPLVYGLAFLFLLISIPLLLGKGSWLIAGYNTATQEEKDKYDEKKLCRTMGVMCLFISFLTILLALINSEEFAIIYGVIVIITVIACIIYCNIGCKRKAEK